MHNQPEIAVFFQQTKPCGYYLPGLWLRNNQYKKIKENYYCPVCIDLPRAGDKIFQCVNGHIICESCISNICESGSCWRNGVECPTCRVPMKDPMIRSIASESIRDDIQLGRLVEKSRIFRNDREIRTCVGDCGNEAITCLIYYDENTGEMIVEDYEGKKGSEWCSQYKMGDSGNRMTAKFHEDGFMYYLKSDRQVRQWVRPTGDLCIDETDEDGNTVRAYFNGRENDPTNIKFVVFPSGTTRTYHKNGGIKHVDLYGSIGISKAFSVRRWRKLEAAHKKTT